MTSTRKATPRSIIALLAMTSAAAADAKCFTRTQAAAIHPGEHLYWHGEDKCWDNVRPSVEARRRYVRSARDEAPAPRRSAPAVPIPQIVAVTDEHFDRPNAQIAFPTMVVAKDMPSPAPFSFEPIHWFSPWPMTKWPLVYDFDEPLKFTPWRKRVE